MGASHEKEEYGTYDLISVGETIQEYSYIVQGLSDLVANPWDIYNTISLGLDLRESYGAVVSTLKSDTTAWFNQ